MPLALFIRRCFRKWCKQSNENVREGQFPNDSIDDDDILYIRFTIGLAEETIIFVPIGIIIARTLGYDALTGAAMVILGAPVVSVEVC